jgi:hypothetical protein
MYFLLGSLQVVTDSAANCAAAGGLVEQQYPHINWSPCAAHTCDLALKDIFGLDYFKSIYSETKEYIAFCTNHYATFATWRDHRACHC